MSINPKLNAMVNKQIRHSQAISHYQRAQRTMLAQIRRVAFDDLKPVHVDEWLSSIESTISTLNKMCIELDQHFESRTRESQHEKDNEKSH